MELTTTQLNLSRSGGAKGIDVGIGIIANDKVEHWLLPFLESWKACNAGIPVFLIPYDNNITRTLQIAQDYGVTVSDVDCRELDALSKKLFPFSLGKRFRLRKLLSLALPVETVIYFDVDIIIFRDLQPLLQYLEPGKVDFIIAAQVEDYVYNSRFRDYDFLREAVTFNDGFFITSNKILNVKDFYDAMKADESTFDKVRQRGGLYAQPLTNFVVHRKRLKTVPAFKLIPGLSAETYHKAKGVRFTADGPVDNEGRSILFAHWPGITGAPKGGEFDKLWADYARIAEERRRSPASQRARP